MAFAGIIGQPEIIKALESSLITGRVGHAYLFLGPAGVGKKTLARAFIRKLLCVGTLEENCACDSCRRFLAGSHPDLITVTPAGNAIKIDQLRELKHQAYFSPAFGKHKIFFFPEAEKLTDTAANSSLKILEEAPPGIVFIFTAVRAENILPTIRSRCQVYQLFPEPLPMLAAELRKRGFTEAETARRVARSRGLPGKALGDNELVDGEPLDFFKEIANRDLIKLFKIAEELEKKERAKISALFQEWESQLRTELVDIYRQNTGAPQRGAALIAILEKIVQLNSMCEFNVNPRLLLDEFFIFVKVNPII